MSTVITERAVLLLNPDADVEDPSSEAGKIMANLLETVAAQPGFVSGHWGRRVGIETNDVEHIVGKLIEKCGEMHNWATLEDHENLNNNPAIIEPMMADLEKIMRAEPPWYHINYYQQSSDNKKTPIPASAFLTPSKGPIIEMIVLHLSPTIPESDISSLETSWAGFARDELRKADGCVCIGQGMVLEELERDGGKVKGYHIAVGWESEEKCAKFQRTLEESEKRFGTLVKGRESCLVTLRAQ